MNRAPEVGRSAAEPSKHEIRDVLRRHVVEAWFPRCVAADGNGLLCDFDRAWRPCGPNDKQLEFQARQTWAAALLLHHEPSNESLRAGVAAGWQCLREVLWDKVHGGWYHRTTQAGDPLLDGAKHVHGISYAISACVALHTLHQMPSTLDVAKDAFAWIERHAHDGVHGGYFGFLTREGDLVANRSAGASRSNLDTIGAPLGCKDLNTQSDLLEAFTELYLAWPEPSVEVRLREMISVVMARMALPSGEVAFLCRPDWTPVPHLIRYGYLFQVACRIVAAARALGSIDEHHHGFARRLVDYTLFHSWDRGRGGVYYGGPATGPP
jgi:cellobiose epimerase